MRQYDPRVVFITLHTTGGDNFTVNPQHILWITHSADLTTHTIYVNDGVGAPTAFIINHTHWLELINASPFVVFIQDASPEG